MTYPALTTFFGAYLNEDVFDIYPDIPAAITDFVADYPRLAELVPVEISALLAGTSDDELEMTTLRLGLAIDGGMPNHREWLTQLADQVRAAT